MTNQITHIAIIRLSAMGDVAMTVPVIRAFADQYPTIKITVVSRPSFQPFFAEIPQVNFFSVDLKDRHKGLIGLFNLYADLKKLEIDAVADLHNVLRSIILRNLFALSGQKVAFTDKGRAEKRALTRAKNKIFKPVKPMVERHVDTFRQLGFSVDLSNPVFPEKAILPMEVLTLTGEKQADKWIGIAPFAKYESKVYPYDLMIKVIESLAKNYHYKIFLFGGGDSEVEILSRLEKEGNYAINIAGKLSLRQELQLISNLDVMLSMDSGNAHIAAMLGIDVITLWGATHPFAGFFPFNQPLENCLTSDRTKFPLLPTSVFGNKNIVGYESAMRTISPEVVVEKIQTSLNKNKS